MQDHRNTINPKVKDVLQIIGIVGLVSASLVFPALPMAVKPILDIKKQKEIEQQKKYWSKFNQQLLRQTLKRLNSQKEIEISEENGESIIRITKKGKVKLLKYRLEEMVIKDQNWDGKWRIIIYDVPTQKKVQADLFRDFIKKIKLYQLQKSVYLTPFDCLEEIEFLREYFGIGQEVIFITALKIEQDQVYRSYFGL